MSSSSRYSSRRPNHFVLWALDFGEFKRFDGSIYRNLRVLSLFILYANANTTLNRHGFQDVNRGNSYILIAFVD